jgi:hypothetical protein
LPANLNKMIIKFLNVKITSPFTRQNYKYQIQLN